MHALEPAAGRAAIGVRPALEKHPKCAEQRQVVLARETREFGGARRGARTVAAQQFEHRGLQSGERERADVGEARDPRDHTLDERNRAIDVAERPQRMRQIGHCTDARVLSEAKGQIVVPARPKQGQRAFQIIARFTILSGEPAVDPSGAAGDSGIRRIGSRLDVAEESRRVRPHRRQLAAQVAASPQAVVGRQPIRRALVAACGRPSSCEGFGRFGRP